MGYSLQRPRARAAHEKHDARPRSFQWATHFNAHAHNSASSCSKACNAFCRFQWATHFNAHAHFLHQPNCLEVQSDSFNGLLTSTLTRTFLRSTTSPASTVSMGYSLQRPRALNEPDTYKAISHFMVSMGYSLQRPRAPGTGIFPR